ncbi:caldesmon isoform X1 [Geospiza fortis]|uniref:Caldesmon isoform X1 n=1 Tax=Geospiza fortis TaxID=48883 RepID=A0A8N5HU70_GEOFO|nr:caldesmon isoform X1 [Geospiza fortis]XP_030916373.1 caldesmon isoform X1 [Geospiza fortis]XP_030916374.1 caldesmon isoform X1 [Geospiza fortis]
MDDFERRRELRRQKREEMRLEAERLSYQRNDDDDEEAARERRRRARQERLRQKEEGDLSGEATEKSEVNAQNSVAGEESKRSTDDEAALLERLARREERRQKRLQEALERQKELDPTITDGSLSVPSRREVNNVEENETTGKEEKAETRRGPCEIEETETVTKSYQRNNWRQDGEEEGKKEEKDKEEEKPKEETIEENQDDKGKAPKEEMKSVWDRKKGVPEQKAQNGEQEPPASKLKPTENAFGRSGAKGAAEEAKPGAEALKRLEDQRRRRGESESEELEKLKEKQQEAAAELDELKKRREERRKILEEEEQKKKQEEAERKIREEEEKRRMKEEIERRRAEAAEKRQKMPEDGVSEDKKPFKCFSPKGSSLKIEERTEFLNKSAQKSGMKPTQTTAVVSKIDSRLEQYTSAIGGTKASRPKASDLHVPAEGVRNIKSMWEKGNVFSSPSGAGTPNKETAGLKVGVSSRINEWLTKTPEGNKSPAPKPSDLRPGDVSGKRNLWEKQSVEKPGAASKVSATGKKSETNAGLRQFEKEP